MLGEFICRALREKGNFAQIPWNEKCEIKSEGGRKN